MGARYRQLGRVLVVLPVGHLKPGSRAQHNRGKRNPATMTQVDLLVVIVLAVWETISSCWLWRLGGLSPNSRASQNSPLYEERERNTTPREERRKKQKRRKMFR
ncbi:uncharacterized protein B0T23DRAFT_165740 [Neurospora hispaniola]|uniref:Uncharacterized protein n=1 Tax=Neurospora hispaniola TaxID=588809 RepID=A0AAJ0MQ94_9PEZI|nr:hypothetical protein B0T23DRAFT_165740 [Neurospora hispaniola]